MDLTFFNLVAIAAIGIQALLLYLFFFEPRLSYKICNPPAFPLDSEEFIRMLEGLADAEFASGNQVEVLTNGENYYELFWEILTSGRAALPPNCSPHTSRV
jgi:hypothetical protein